MSGRNLRSAAGLALWAGGLAVATTVLFDLGGGALSTPPVHHGWAELHAWMAERDAATVVMALLRVAGLGMALYLVATTAVGIAVRLAGVPAAIRAVDLVTVPLVRQVLAGTVGVILAAGPLVSPGGGYASTPEPTTSSSTTVLASPHDPPIMRRLPDGPGPTTTATPTTAVPPVVTTSPSRIGAPGVAPGAGPDTAGPAPQVSTPSGPPVPATLESWTVRPGDHLWLIAATVTRRHTGTAELGAVDRYWRAVIELNRSSLPDPANPDLLFSGMEIRLPPLPA
ncbi:MAG: hypothetical protein NVS3B12_12870 [Acidimicrobiales bacterium]